MCAADLSVVRSVSNMFSVGEVSLNISMLCLYQKFSILADALQQSVARNQKAEWMYLLRCHST